MDKFYVKPVQTVNYGQVSLPTTTTTLVRSANPSRVKVKLTLVGGDGNTWWFGSDSSVTNSNGFFITTEIDSTPVEIVLNWQTDVYIYNAGSNGQVSFAEELLA